MKHQKSVALGAMIGSSLDGLDLALVEFVGTDSIQWRLLAQTTIDLPPTLLVDLDTLSAKKMGELDVEIGRWIGTAISSFCSAPYRPSVLGVHGLTIFHDPQKGLSTQLGHGAHIAQVSGIDTVVDFRTSDIALGGQGAPLVPLGERFLFPGFHQFLNLGGIANLTVSNSDGTFRSGDLTGCNQVLNRLSQQLGKPFDDRGAIARSGTIDQPLLNSLNNQPFCQQAFPKSLSNQWVRREMWSIVETADCSIPDKLATVVEHIAQQVVAFLDYKKMDVFLTGGGTHNHFLIERLKSYGLKLHIPHQTIIDYKEAIIFAFLAYRRKLGLPTTIPMATGAAALSSGGALYKGTYEA